MDKPTKLLAIKIMATPKNDKTSPEPDTHMAKCPKCGYEWEMSDEDYAEEG